jgi:hypothetical protein
MRGDRLCFVLCVESGPLESMTVRSIQSLRLFGGRLADVPVLAMTPRRGPPLSSSTRRRLRELHVEHVRLSGRRSFSWYHYLNKPTALAEAERLADTELVAFLDSDTLVLQEPDALLLDAGVDFIASVSDVELGGTTGPGHPNEDGWRRICELVGLVPDDLPWVHTPVDGARIRLYFNSGVMAYRRAQHVGAQQLELLTRVFEEGIRLPGPAGRMVEQVVLAPLVLSRGISWTGLPFSHNSTMISLLPYNPAHLREARVLHYHDSMAPESWDEFLARIAAEQAQVAPWLRSVGPITSPASVPARILGESFRIVRGLRRRLNDASLRFADT